MKNIIALLLSTSLVCGSLFVPAQAKSFSDAQKGELEEIIRGYLLEHPEILRDMSTKLDEKEKKAEAESRSKALVENAKALFKTATDPEVGNPKGNVTIIEFMDYNCGWCKKSVGEVTSLVGSDKNLRVVFKDFPIFGEHSEYAARAALAAKNQGKYWPFHQAMFAHEGQVTKDVVDELAAAQGLDMAKLKEDMKSQPVIDAIAANYDLAKALGLTGTPAFIIDDKVSPGYMQLEDMQATVAEVRANGCKYC